MASSGAIPLIVLMLATGIYFTVRSGFFQFTHFGWIMKNTVGQIFHGTADKNESGKGMLHPFETIATAIGGTVGFGNIAGVATAVAAGGPGAVFWMWLTAALGMILKQVEVTLGCYYPPHPRRMTSTTFGGPTYYMEYGLGKERHWGKLWLIPAVIFGIGIFSTFFVTSSTLTASQVVAGAFHLGSIHIGSLEVEGIILVGIGLTVIDYVITSGGVKGVAQIFSKLVPVMSIIYILMGIVMIVVNINRVPTAFVSIFHDAFTGTAAVGGFAGVAVSEIVRVGMARAVYSNEAGWGTSPMIHSSARTNHPVSQGLWGSFEVFFDTFIICTITALSVILSGMWTDGTNGGTLALEAFQQGFGQVGAWLLARHHDRVHRHHLRRLVHLLHRHPEPPVQEPRGHLRQGSHEAVLPHPCTARPAVDHLSGQDQQSGLCVDGRGYHLRHPPPLSTWRSSCCCPATTSSCSRTIRLAIWASGKVDPKTRLFYEEDAAAKAND